MHWNLIYALEVDMSRETGVNEIYHPVSVGYRNFYVEKYINGRRGLLYISSTHLIGSIKSLYRRLSIFSQKCKIIKFYSEYKSVEKLADLD